MQRGVYPQNEPLPHEVLPPTQTHLSDSFLISKKGCLFSKIKYHPIFFGKITIFQLVKYLFSMANLSLSN
ncbi:hypothetical protein A2634_03120 [Candidatus Amesbacteria bacterium RIFCSPHIGHO2_01_FULL_48_32]|uniref:Uncharacterized protein n=1 Tax=Candidatus Amesbacteria bacterium RIFCSPLOWO2_01_FULL_48_25 TaxID=1797259 RepID=A0A1F4ZB64_9BACT|nr:MAG: hypothetical protein A2634_03120 [Candidatus Amesbacteria bacterium RIFCSPHIGHO2_01_FULL_48_32]OGD03600.1 MAG: hypothetical protein A2989_02870 [Candidatus Amesbacteria bacterium RIFCSPLOWO2_01_FULL_48_25]